MVVVSRTTGMSGKSKILVAVALVVVVATAWFARPSLRRPESSIRASLLKQTPLGSTSQEVRALMERRGWLDRHYVGSTGFLKQDPGVPAVEVGVTSIRGELGHYWQLPRPLPFRTDVTAFWGFDKEGRLIDLWVWKTTDAL
jgi:hypothetical protein